MKALIVLDCQKGMLARGDFDLLRENILKLQEMFKASGDLIIHTRHIDENEESIIYNGDERGELDEELSADADFIVEKDSPNIFKSDELKTILANHPVDEVVITGLNAEYCCLFSAIIASDRGYKVTYIEDATGSVNDGDTYEMPGLDLWTSLAASWIGLGKSRFYTSMSSKREGKIRIEIRSRRSKICLLFRLIEQF